MSQYPMLDGIRKEAALAKQAGWGKAILGLGAHGISRGVRNTSRGLRHLGRTAKHMAKGPQYARALRASQRHAGHVANPVTSRAVRNAGKMTKTLKMPIRPEGSDVASLLRRMRPAQAKPAARISAGDLSRLMRG